MEIPFWNGRFSQTIICCWRRFDPSSPLGQKQKRLFIFCSQFYKSECDLTSWNVNENEATAWKFNLTTLKNGRCQFFSWRWMLSRGREILSPVLSSNWRRRNEITHRTTSYDIVWHCMTACDIAWPRMTLYDIFHSNRDDKTKSLVTAFEYELACFSFYLLVVSWPDVILLSWANICSVTK